MGKEKLHHIFPVFWILCLSSPDPGFFGYQDPDLNSRLRSVEKKIVFLTKNCWWVIFAAWICRIRNTDFFPLASIFFVCFNCGKNIILFPQIAVHSKWEEMCKKGKNY